MKKFVQNGDKVEVHFSGRLKDGEVFNSTKEGIPFRFTVGEDELIVGLGGGMLGMEVGEKRIFEVPPEEAYGEYDKLLLFDAPANEIPPGLQVGSVLSDPGKNRKWVVKKLGGKTTLLDGNHPLAGKTLVFEVELISIS